MEQKTNENETRENIAEKEQFRGLKHSVLASSCTDGVASRRSCEAKTMFNKFQPCSQLLVAEVAGRLKLYMMVELSCSKAAQTVHTCYQTCLQ